jgi:tRNA dimethylallyltransferase
VNKTLTPLFIIAGPTAVGKSAVAVEVAERCGGEIVSADAFQIYEGFDILTAKPDPTLLARVPHHLIGEIPRGRSFDVAQYLQLALQRIADIRDRGRIPIIVGGAGFYLKALTDGLPDLPSADANLRSQLDCHTTPELARQLAELDPECHSQIDRNNRRRLIRALEVCLLTGEPFSSFRELKREPIMPSIGFVLNRGREELYARINERTGAMFAAGVLDEVRQADDVGLTAAETLGWMPIRSHLNGGISREKCIEWIQQTTRHYAKRQLTWFRRESKWEWITLSGNEMPAPLIEELAQRARESARI